MQGSGSHRPQAAPLCLMLTLMTVPPMVGKELRQYY